MDKEDKVLTKEDIKKLNFHSDSTLNISKLIRSHELLRRLLLIERRTIEHKFKILRKEFQRIYEI